VKDDKTGDRIDYVRISRKWDVQRGIEWSNGIIQVLREWQSDHPSAKGGHKAGTVKRFDDGEYLYSVQVWGEACGFLERLDFDRYYKYCSRLDFRMEVDLTPDGIDKLEAVAKQHNSRKRNIQKIDSRAREKKEGRSPGGYGLSIGSHGSTKRLSCYKRGKERGAMELQVALAECTKTLNRAVVSQNMRDATTNRQKWETVLVYGIDELEATAQSMFSSRFDDILLVGGNGGADAPANEVAAWEINRHLDLLDRDQKKELLLYLQQSLF
jgi:hypothetical protein